MIATPERPLRYSKACREQPQDSDLAAVIDAWDTLPEAVRASIPMLVGVAAERAE